MKKILFIILGFIGLGIMPMNSFASDTVTVYFFRGYNCPHCEDSLEYLNAHKEDIPENVKIVTYEVWKNTNNEKLHAEVAQKLNLDEDDYDSVPLIVVGDQYIIGMDGTKADFDKLISLTNTFNSNNYKDVVSETVKEMQKQKAGMKFKALTLEDLYSDNKVATIVVSVVFGVLVVGFVGMIIFSRKN